MRRPRPLDPLIRQAVYMAQTGRKTLTPRQRRRALKKNRRAGVIEP